MRRDGLPGTSWTLDDYPIEVGSEWTATEAANLGFDQFRGAISPRSAHRLPWTAGVGSRIRGVTDDGVTIWEGSVSAPLQIETDDRVLVEGQGAAYESAKLSDRFPIKVKTAEAWTIANASPLNLTQVANEQPTVSYDKENQTGANASLFSNNTVDITLSTATDFSIAFWAKGARIARFSAFLRIGSDVNRRVEVYAANGPDIAGTMRHVMSNPDSVGQSIDFDLPADSDYDALIIRGIHTASSTTGTQSFLTDPVVWCETRSSDIRAREVARGIGDHLGWDTAGVQDIGDAVFPTFDWGGTAIGAMSEAVGPDDLVWQVRHHTGHGYLLEMREWGEREYVVSGATGARWNLQRMERYNRVTAQFLDEIGQARTVTVNADPDPLNGRAIKEATVTLGGLVPVDGSSNSAEVLAQKVLDALSVQRQRGDVVAARVYYNDTPIGYGVRAGDTLRIADGTRLEGAITDRIVSIAKGPGGIVFTFEPAVLAGGALAGASGSTPGTLLRPTNITPYLPPGSPGSTTPRTQPPPATWGPNISPGGGGNGAIVPLPPEWGSDSASSFGF